MSKRLVIVLWVIAVALGGLVYVVKSGQSTPAKGKAARKSGQTLFESFPGAEVAAITISGADGTTHLAKKDGKWTVTDRDAYPANTQNVNDLIRTIGDVKVVGAIEDAASYSARFGIDPSAAKAEDRGIELTFANASGSELAKVSLGKSIGGSEAGPMGPMGGGSTGRFVLNQGDKSAIYRTSEMFSAVSTDPKTWLSEDFIKIEKPKSVSVTVPGKGDIAWKVSRDNEEANFNLEGAKPEDNYDASTATPLKTLFSFAKFDDVVPTADVAKRAQPDQKRVATIETFEGSTYTLNITPAKAADAKPGEEPPAATDGSYFVTVDVTATLPTERKKEEGEKPEDAKVKDEAFTTRLKDLKAKLAADQALKGRTFELRQFALDMLLKGRDGFKKQAAPAGGPQGMQGMQGLPPGMMMPHGATPGPGTKAGPVEAVTPPIQVPAQSEDDK
ncbi:DUF4340 domain-containing protein [Luteolibacter ambystomatis]|uniref:DUF4340 domain-containing protein n=1 Tax=Luteolibacter ambystomatis TaxID=2824561 RepID=A0A975G6E7_9BACT|nr:DUF4340 domain-containing protein [Luteolibacter ambystomatis]QUE49643.1 DUF4340 domain-containing protein [Luteolibacter ambystomatis]